MTTTELLKQLRKLEPLDLSKCHTVSDIVGGMERCSFTARCLGKVAHTLYEWTNSGDRAFIVCDHASRPLAALIAKMCNRGWFAGPYTSLDYLNLYGTPSLRRVMVIGNYNEATADRLHESSGEMIFINQFHRAKPGQVRDGYFPNVVFADPNYIVPILFAVLRERKGYESTRTTALFEDLRFFPGLAAEVVLGGENLCAMAREKKSRRFLTLSGAMTIAKMQLVACEMIEKLDFHYVASTGALMAHGFIEGTGDTHYEYDPTIGDDVLAKHGLNRVTDSIEPEENFDHLDEIMDKVLGSFDGSKPISPSMIHKAMGAFHQEHYPDCRGILRLAHERNIPVLVPAFHDSEIGNDVFVHNLLRQRRGKKKLVIDQELDTQKLVGIMTSGERPCIFSVGGGVPRNFTQNVAPLTEIANAREAANWPIRKFYRGCKIDPTPLVLGNLGAATYDEMKSWRKADKDGIFCEIHACATVTWPFMVKYAIENMR